MPKMSCPRFYGHNPAIWRDKCQDYFALVNLPPNMWATAAALHMDGNAEKWMQVYKKKQGITTWEKFISDVCAKFGAFEYQHAIDELLDLHQTSTMEEYTEAFEALHYQIVMHDPGMRETYFISQYIKGLKT